MISRELFASVERWVRETHPALWDFYRAEGKKEGRGYPNPVIPRCGNDKFFWRKVFDHDPRFTQIADKLGVRDWFKEEGIDVATPEVLWRGTDVSTIPDDIGPAVMKSNNGQGQVLRILDGRPPNLEASASQMLTAKRFRRRHEWGYFDIEPELFLERYIEGIDTTVQEYKFYTFGEQVERLVPIYNRTTNMTAAVWEPDGKGFVLSPEPAVRSPYRDDRPLPDTIDTMTGLAKQIGSHFDHMRIDFYSDGTDVMLSELAAYNFFGLFPTMGTDPDNSMNRAWNITNTWFLTTPQDGWKQEYANELRVAYDF